MPSRSKSLSLGIESTERVGRGCGLVFFALFALIGLVATVFVASMAWDNLRSQFWEATPCTIVKSELNAGKGNSRTLDLSYLYSFHGRELTGTRLKLSGNQFDNLTAAQRAAREYRSDQRRTCYVNRSAPRESVLELPHAWSALVVLFPLIFVAIGVAGFIWLWRAKSATAKPLSERARQTGGATALRIVGFFFALIGGVFTYLLWLSPWLKARDAAKWVETPCVIRSSAIKVHSDSDGGPTYSVEITYGYVFDGEEVIGTRYNFASGSSSSRDWRKRAVDAHPPGRATVCYVNPNDPLDSVLVREMSSDSWFGLLGGVFVLAGVGMFIGAGAAKRRGKSAVAHASLSGAPMREFHGSIGTLSSDSGGPITLRPAFTPLAAFIGLLIVAVIWNGIVWGILLLSNPPTVAKVFLGIFCLIGLGILAGAVHQFLALFNPRPTLQANASALRLGESLELRYTFSGRVRRITGLTIRLKGEEVATYRRGTDTTTDRHVFFLANLLDTADHALIPSGAVTITIPGDSMHSFNAPNNKIEWKLEFHGAIPRWPDVKLDFPIAVLPRAIHAAA